MRHKTSKRLLLEFLLIPLAIIIIQLGFPTKVLELALVRITSFGLISGMLILFILLYMICAGFISGVILGTRIYARLLAKMTIYKRKRSRYEK